MVMDKDKVYSFEGCTPNQYRAFMVSFITNNPVRKIIGTLGVDFWKGKLLGTPINNDGYIKLKNIPERETLYVKDLDLPKVKSTVKLITQEGGDGITRFCHLNYDTEATGGSIQEYELPSVMKLELDGFSYWEDRQIIFVNLIDEEKRVFRVTIEEYEKLRKDSIDRYLTLYHPVVEEIKGKRKKKYEAILSL